ncbi:MAG: TIGR01777 family oxidoreductase, partial [Candidatus Planktophila sp.]
YTGRLREQSNQTKKYRAEILNSRLLGTTAIAKAVAEVKPQVFISASAIGWYGESGNRAVVESDRVGDDFLAAVCREWEAAADLAHGVRTVKLRTGLVLDPTGGALGKMLPLFRLGLGGKLGNGKQWWSWITLHDVIRAISFILEHDITGPVNLTSPNPVTNQEFTSALARAMHRPALFPAPAFGLKIALGGFSSEILGSKKVMPQALTSAGFTWDYSHITNALTALIEE